MSYDFAPLPTHSPSTFPSTFPSTSASAPAAPAAVGPLVWHPANDIQTVEGLGGSFMWGETPFFPRVITFNFVPRPGPQGQDGTYTLGFVEQGPFYAVPNNPASGIAFISLQPSSPRVRAFVITGMLTDSNWRIYIMRLNRFVGNNPSPVSFQATRIA